MTSIFVGNLSKGASENDLETAFSQFGSVSSVTIVKERETGQPRGFAFVEMSDKEEAARAIQELNLKEINGRSVTVNEAKPRANRPHAGSARRRNW